MKLEVVIDSAILMNEQELEKVNNIIDKETNFEVKKFLLEKAEEVNTVINELYRMANEGIEKVEVEV